MKTKILLLMLLFCTVANAQTDSTLQITKEHGKYRYGTQTMNSREYKQFLQLNCPDAYKQYNLGRNCTISGWTLLGTCSVATLASTFGFLTHTPWGVPKWKLETEEYRRLIAQQTASLVFIPISFAGVIASIPLLTVGYKNMSRSIDTYNQQCSTPPLALSLQAGNDGLGIVLNF